MAVGAIGMILLAAVYLGIVSLAESPGHALELLWGDRWLVLPILLTFGIQVGLYSVFRSGAHVATASAVPAAAGGGLSTVAMAACCVHHVTDLLPMVGISLAASFLAAWKTPLMALGLGTNLLAIGLMTWLIRRGRRRLPVPVRRSE